MTELERRERRERLDAEMTELSGLFDGFTYEQFLAAQPPEFLAEWYALANDNSVIAFVGFAANDNDDAPRADAA